MHKLKETLTVGILALTLVGGMAAHLLLPDQEISKAERRKLDQLPQFSTEALLSGKYATDLEDYLLDQFPLRDGFRTLISSSIDPISRFIITYRCCSYTFSEYITTRIFYTAL